LANFIEITPQENNDCESDEIVADTNYDFLSHRNNYSNDQLQKIENQFIKIQKELAGDENENENETPEVQREQLNKMQKFAYDLVQEKQRIREQLLMIINGSAGTGKSFTIFSLSHMIKHKLKRSAPTAKAAFIIKGQTIHSRFNFNQKRDSPICEELKGPTLAQFKINLKI
jgi:RecA-family ATPase